jgi:hypothetical protein
MRGYRGNASTRQAGYAYLTLLILIATDGVAAAVAIQLDGIYLYRID